MVSRIIKDYGEFSMRDRLIKTYWDKIGCGYSLFWQCNAKQKINKKELNFINKYLQMTNKRYVLDIGIGTGRIIDNYLRISKSQNIYGIDIAKSMVKHCQYKYKNEKRVKCLKVCNIAKKSVPLKRKFDFISVVRVLKYNKNWRNILGKIILSLNRKGVLVFTIPNTFAIRRFTISETPMYTTTQSEIEKLCKKLHLEILELITLSRLPDIFYDISNNKIYIKILLFSEKALQKLLGTTAFGKIFFVAVRRKHY